MHVVRVHEPSDTPGKVSHVCETYSPFDSWSEAYEYAQNVNSETLRTAYIVEIKSPVWYQEQTDWN